MRLNPRVTYDPPLRWQEWESYVKLKAILCTPEDVARWLERVRAERENNNLAPSPRPKV